MEFGADDDLLADVLAILDDNSEGLPTAAASPNAHESTALSFDALLALADSTGTNSIAQGSRGQLNQVTIRLELAADAVPDATDTAIVWNGPVDTISSSGGKTASKYDPNRARNDLTRQLNELRTEEVKLNRKLAALQHLNSVRMETLALDASTEAPLAAGTEPRIWKEICCHQLERRMLAETENARLKQVVNDQMNITKNLQRMLRKPVKQLDAETLHGATAKRVHSLPSDSKIDEAIFSRLLAEVERSYCGIDEVFAVNDLSFSSPLRRDAHMREGTQGRYVDLVCSRLLPFTFDATAAVLWDFFSGTDKHHGPLYYKTTKTLHSSTDTIMEKFALELRAETTRADFRMWQIMRRFVEGEVVKVVWVCFVEPTEFNNRPFSGCAYQEKGYVACKKADLPTTWSHLLCCHRVVPYITHDADTVLTSEQEKEIGSLIEFTLSLDSIHSQIECIEDMLVRSSLRDQRDVSSRGCIASSD